jgi:hypothetical protein
MASGKPVLICSTHINALLQHAAMEVYGIRDLAALSRLPPIPSKWAPAWPCTLPASSRKISNLLFAENPTPFTNISAICYTNRLEWHRQ